MHNASSWPREVGSEQQDPGSRDALEQSGPGCGRLVRIDVGAAGQLRVRELGGVVDAVARAALGGSIAPPASRSEEISPMSDDSASRRQSHP